jgi:3',5'-cyclic AMP phosphodiesterase CpdA
VPVTADPLTTARQRLVPGQARDGGYRALVPADGEQHYQVAAAMVRAVREIAAAPLSGAPIDLAAVTGDATDNCQRNELRSYIDLLDGGQVLPDSGDPQRYEGVAGPQVEDGG